MANDLIVGDELQDIVNAGGRGDTIRGGLNAEFLNGDTGNDTFELAASEVGSGETIDGGADVDRILALSNVSLVNATVSSIEEIEFNFPNATAITVTVRADQIGAGLAANLVVDGNLNNLADNLRIVMGADTVVDLSAFTFQTFDTGPAENDRIFVIGDADAERISGSSVRDDITGGGGNDSLSGGGGKDVLRGGQGNDLYTVNVAGEAIEGANQGVDTVRSNVSYALGANIENLSLIGGAAVNGTGNTLDNTIIGNGAANSLNGLRGDDTLTGGVASDRFLFTTAFNPATNVDTITDFTVGADEIRLDNAVFAALPAGALAPGAFRVGAVAGDANDRIIYNAANGNLFYDGSGAGALRGARPRLGADGGRLRRDLTARPRPAADRSREG